MAYVTVPKDFTRVKSKVVFGPVSYTHLDVYKRQVYICRFGH